MRRRLLNWPHFVKTDMRTQTRSLPRGFDASKTTTNNYYFIHVDSMKRSRFLLLHRLHWFGRIDFVVFYVARKVPVVAPFDCLIQIAATEQQKLKRKIYLGEPWQPNSFIHACLFHHHGGARPQ